MVDLRTPWRTFWAPKLGLAPKPMTVPVSRVPKVPGVTAPEKKKPVRKRAAVPEKAVKRKK
jgi:hypothetical protein